MRIHGAQKNSVIGKPRYRRSILVLKPQNGEFDRSKSTFCQVFTSVKLQLVNAFIFFILSKKEPNAGDFNFGHFMIRLYI